MQKHRLPVDEFTTPDPLTADVNTRVEQLMGVMRDNGIRHLPITEGKKIVGIISDRDLRLVKGLQQEKLATITAKDIMAPDPISVHSSTPLDEVAFLMSEKKIGSVLVFDEGENFYGIFTATDALNALIEMARGEL